MLTRQLQTSLFFSHRALSSSFTRSYTEMEDTFLKQYFFRKSFLKPFTIAGENNLLSVTCVKGRFKQNKDYIALEKLGAILLEFVPFVKDSEGQQQLDLKSKKNFALNIKNIGEILKNNPYNFEKSHIKLEFNYHISSQAEDKKLLIQKTSQEEKLQVTLQSQKKGVNSNVTTSMDVSDFIIFQELLKYSIPYVLGWHIMNSPRVAEEEFSSNPPDKPDNY